MKHLFSTLRSQDRLKLAETTFCDSCAAVCTATCRRDALVQRSRDLGSTVLPIRF